MLESTLQAETLRQQLCFPPPGERLHRRRNGLEAGQHGGVSILHGYERHQSGVHNPLDGAIVEQDFSTGFLNAVAIIQMNVNR